MKTPLQKAAIKAKDWLWLYVADCAEMSETAREAASLANELEAAINMELEGIQRGDDDQPQLTL